MQIYKEINSEGRLETEDEGRHEESLELERSGRG